MGEKLSFDEPPPHVMSKLQVKVAEDPIPVVQDLGL